MSFFLLAAGVGMGGSGVVATPTVDLLTYISIADQTSNHGPKYATPGQKHHLIAYDENGRVTGEAANITVELSKDGGAAEDVTFATATEIGSYGEYTVDLTIAEVTAHELAFNYQCATAGVNVRGEPSSVQYTTLQQDIYDSLYGQPYSITRNPDNPPIEESWTHPVIDAAFLARSDVYVMYETTLGIGGSINRWPVQMENPRTYNINYILIMPGSYTNRKATNYEANPGRYYPFQSGADANNPLWIIGVENLEDQDISDLVHPANRTKTKVILNVLFLTTGGLYTGSYVRLCGITFRNQTQITNTATEVVLSRCEYDTGDVQPIRIRNTTTRCGVSQCYIHREPPFSTTVDRMGIQFDDGVHTDAFVEYCTIVGYTDSIQTTNTGVTIYNEAVGLQIRDNFLGFLPHHRSDDDTESLGGNEQPLDFKTGGTALKPVIVDSNYIFGCRPNSKTPGYAITFHISCDNIVLTNNVFSDNESAFFLNAQYEDGNVVNGWHPNAIEFSNNLFSRCNAHGSAYFTTKQGFLYIGSHTATIENNSLVDIDAFSFENPNAGALLVQAMVIAGNALYDAMDYGTYYADEAAWLTAGNTVETTGTETVVVPVPFTRETITVVQPIGWGT